MIPRVQPRTKVRVGLTPAERRVFALIGRGLCNKQICRELGSSLGTVKVHASAVLKKTGSPNRVVAALKYHGVQL